MVRRSKLSDKDGKVANNSKGKHDSNSFSSITYAIEVLFGLSRRFAKTIDHMTIARKQTTEKNEGNKLPLQISYFHAMRSKVNEQGIICSFLNINYA